MSSKMIKTELCIARSSDNIFRIEVRCQASRTLLANVQMDADQFAQAITGLYQSDINCEIGDMSRVGKRRVSESRQVQPPFDSYSREDCQKWLKENCQEDGWLIDAYLGSRSSMVRVGGKLTLNYSVYKYVEIE